MLRIGYMSAHWGVLPLAASGALARFDPDRTSIAVFTLGAQVRQMSKRELHMSIETYKRDLEKRSIKETDDRDFDRVAVV